MKSSTTTFFGILLGVCIGCASSGDGAGRTKTTATMMIPDMDGASTAQGAAYTADSMHFRKPMPSRPDWKPLDFYYKHCSSGDSKVYYSKTSYECSGL